MSQQSNEIPAKWFEELDKLKQRVAELPEDEEDRAIRASTESYSAMTPAQQARIDAIGEEVLERMQTEKQKSAMNKLFDEIDQSDETKS